MYVLHVAFSDVAFILRNISPYFFFAEPYDTKCLWRIVVFVYYYMYVYFIYYFLYIKIEFKYTSCHKYECVVIHVFLIVSTKTL